MRTRKLSFVSLSILIFAFSSSGLLITLSTSNSPYFQLQNQFGVNSESDTKSRDYWPTSRWLNSTPKKQNMDSSILNDMLAHIYEQDYNFDSIIIVRNGYMVLEEYPNPRYDSDDLHILYSVTKSITSCLIGIAIDYGFIDNISQKVIDFFPDKAIANLDARKQRITLEHLLTMTAGFEWEGPDDMYHSWGDAVWSGNPVEHVLNQSMQYEPGTNWYYNGGCSHLLSAILTRTTGNSTLNFAKKYLFEPLNITKVYWPIDPQRIYYGGQDIRLTPPDMAKLGYLFLNNGTWNGEQVVSKEWVQNSTQTSFSFNANEGYGYQWWTYKPLNAYFAWGNFEQRIIILPDLDLVVVFTAEIEDISIEPDLLFNYILPAVLDKEYTTVVTHNTSASTLLNALISFFGVILVSSWFTKQKRRKRI